MWGSRRLVLVGSCTLDGRIGAAKGSASIIAIFSETILKINVGLDEMIQPSFLSLRGLALGYQGVAIHREQMSKHY